MPLCKTPEQIAVMRRAGRVVAEMLEAAASAARPGAATADLDLAAREVLDRRGARSSFLGYHGFPAVVCVSPNEVVIHGIPGPRVLEEGDIVSIDGGAIVNGWHADAAITVGVGDIDTASEHLIDTTRAALAAATRRTAPGSRLGDVGEACEAVVRAAGLAVVRDYAGHGIGTAMHEEPQVPNHGRAGRGARLRAGHGPGHRADGRGRRGGGCGACRRVDRGDPGRQKGRPLRGHGRHHREWPEVLTAP